MLIKTPWNAVCYSSKHVISKLFTEEKAERLERLKFCIDFSKYSMFPVFFIIQACYTEELFNNGLFNVHAIYSHLRF